MGEDVCVNVGENVGVGSGVVEEHAKTPMISMDRASKRDNKWGNLGKRLTMAVGGTLESKVRIMNSPSLMAQARIK